MKPRAKCPLCGREAATVEAAEAADSNNSSSSSTGFCRYHQQAYENLKAGFEKWRYAYGETSWTDYLRLIANIPETGAWVKECCEHLLREKKTSY
ncbi:MAG: hypothetical protein M1503_04885 [Thaumarchaeota archaeon]|nr:hypothetical protein [Nitrososphaerota archaeon]MCL5317587.1 hypothetical protein [Nitrososphaerota archaeon]